MMNLDDIIGQQAVTTHLRNALSKDKLAQAYMIIGEDGMGKETIAKAFASSILCEDRQPGEYLNCGKCRSCHQIETGNHPDLRVVTHEKPAAITVDEIRTQVVSDVDIRPYQEQRKVYIIPDAQLMNEQAQKALLETLEEPPEYVVIILLCANENMLLQTIRSRCIKLSLAPLPEEVIEDTLKSQYHIPDYRSRQIVKFTRGNLGRAADIAGQDDFLTDMQTAVDIMKGVVGTESYEWSGWIDSLTEDKSRIPFFLDMFIDWYRDVLMMKSGADQDKLMFSDESSAIREEAESYRFADIRECIDAIWLADRRIKENVKPELVLINMFRAFRNTYGQEER